ncbi:fibronectin type III domain-containing protein [Flavobacterium foetidum]|uniref:fibronectin type III domain-containing protein n=1 Tax=Flavobacterium foetidum TaxID=2026681 RepID=UPI0010754E55|nr:fibronectin type III domain-containing protein [Flavobacterium foetidum]KAF2515708.1 hypothetical protein E0W73_08955 [Flavobacterium foetidum]
MKKIIYLSIIALLVSCGDDSDSEVKNEAPSIPQLTSPADNKLCNDNNVVFEWKKSTDKNNDEIVYLIEIATDNQFTEIVQSIESALNSESIELDKNTAYYWRIKATDTGGLSSEYSKIYKFYTTGEAVINHLPFLPELVAPALNSLQNTTSVSLRWNAEDSDPSDYVSYDVYFGTVNPPVTKLRANTISRSTSVMVEPAKEYFWRVVAKDNNGGETVGQVWRFKTN